MLLANATVEKHEHGVQSSIQFRVATNAKMMKMLSDNLYSDKIAAPVRELSTNALDSHIAAGCPNKPFHVHLPCSVKPEFRIRDFGIGLTQEQMEDLYTTYGDSDKNGSNDYVGCMGLGSKSPFAYTDSFTATSFKDGMKYVYIAGRDATGIPTLNRMLVESTTEPNGLEVSFGVKREHFQTFYERARKIYVTFPTLPIITGFVTNLSIPQPNIALQGTGWRLPVGGNESTAIMGYISYPIEPKYFSKYKTENNTWYGKYQSDDNTEAELLKLGLEIHFPIGAVEMDISREHLQYNKITIDEIKKRLVIIADEIKVLVSEHFKACKSAWEARCLWNELFGTGLLRGLSGVAKLVGTTWKDIEIDKQVNVKTTDNLDMVSVVNGRSYTRRHTQNYIRPEKTTKFYINDMKRGAYAIAERDSRTNSNTIWIITFKGTDTEMADAKRDFIQDLGIDPSELIYVSTLPQAAKVNATGPRKTKQFEFNNRKDGGNRYGYTPRAQGEWWKEVTIDLSEDSGYYVPLTGFTITRTNGNMDAQEFGNLLLHAKELGIKIPKIYGIRPSHVDKIKGDAEWVNFFDYLKEELDLFVQKNNYITTLEELNGLGSINPDKYEEMYRFVDKLDINKPFAQFLTHVARIQKAKNTIGDKVSPLTCVASVVEYTLPKMSKVFDCKKEQEKLNKTYPLWGMISFYRLESQQARDIVDYVNLVDKQ